jgi:3-oxoacyl-[acyl-carrier-protein] synthase-1
VSVELAVVAVGARTPVGLAAEPSACAAHAGIGRLREFPFATSTGEPIVVASDARLDPCLEGRERLLPLALSTVLEVSRKLGDVVRRAATRVLLVLPATRPGFSEADAAWVVDTLRSRLRGEAVELPVELAGRGHAGAIAVIDRLSHADAGRDAGLSLLVAVDSYLHTDTLLWLERERLLASPDIRSGFFPGEAAGCLVLASPSLCRSLRLPVLARFVGVGVARESRLRDSETGSLGVGMTAAVQAALGTVIASAQVDVVYNDLNGERYRSEEWGFVALRLGAAFGASEYAAPADSWGDVGAAFGALATILAVQSWARGYARGPRALVAAGSFDGQRGALLLSSPNPP